MKPIDRLRECSSLNRVANEAALDLHRRAWPCDPSRYFEPPYKTSAARLTKGRTLVTERLDQRARTALSRARGKRLEDLPDAWCSRRRTGGGAEWKLSPWREDKGSYRAERAYSGVER